MLRCIGRPTDTGSNRREKTKQNQSIVEDNDDSDVSCPIFVDQPVNNELKELKVDAAEMCLVQLDGNDVNITVARGTSVFCAVTFNQMLHFMGVQCFTF